MNLPDPAAFLRNVVTSPSYWSAGILWSVLADAQATGGSYTLVEQLCPKGPLALMHVPKPGRGVLYPRRQGRLSAEPQRGNANCWSEARETSA